MTMKEQIKKSKINKFTAIIPTILCLIIAIFLQCIFFATSPKIEANLLPQLSLALKTVLIEYFTLGFLLLILNSFIYRFNKRENIKSLVIFSFIDLLTFIVWFTIYANK
jgi:hypothetical protein